MDEGERGGCEGCEEKESDGCGEEHFDGVLEMGSIRSLFLFSGGLVLDVDFTFLLVGMQCLYLTASG